MPSSVSTALLAFGLILAVTGAATAAIVAGVLALAFEVILLIAAGLD